MECSPYSGFSLPRLPGETTCGVAMRITQAALLALTILAITGAVAYGVNYCLTELSPCHYPVWLMSVAMMGAGLVINVKLAYYFNAVLSPEKRAQQSSDDHTPSAPVTQSLARKFGLQIASAYQRKINNGVDLTLAQAQLVTEAEKRAQLSKQHVQTMLNGISTFTQLTEAVVQGLQWQHVIGYELVAEDQYPNVQAAFHAAQQYVKYKDAAVVTARGNGQFQFTQLRRSSLE